MIFSPLLLLGHIYNILYVVGSGFKDIVWLRGTLTLAAALEIIYYWNILNDPLWHEILWSAVLIIVNLTWISRLLYSKATLNLEPLELELLQLTFKKLNPINFKKLLQISARQTHESDVTLIEENTNINDLMILVRGVARVEKNGKTEAYLRAGSFIGEISYVTGQPTTATVITDGEVELLSWDKEKLGKFLKKNEKIAQQLDQALHTDTIQKLIADKKNDDKNLVL